MLYITSGTRRCFAMSIMLFTFLFVSSALAGSKVSTLWTGDQDLSDSNPSISADGSLVAFTTYRKTSGEGYSYIYPTIHVCNSDGTNQRILYSSDVDAQLYSLNSEFSPDGKNIIYNEYHSRLELHRKSIAGGNSVNLGMVDYGKKFSYSPNGIFILFVRDGLLYSCAANSDSPVALTGNQQNGALLKNFYNGFVGQYTITSDSSKVIYLADDYDTHSVVSLYCVPISGGIATKLNSNMVNGGNVVAFDISADLKKVAYIADKDTDNLFELYSVAISGGVSTKLNGVLPSGEGVRSCRVSPLGNFVAYASGKSAGEGGGLFSVPISGGNSVNISGSVSSALTPISYWPYGFSPNEDRLIFKSYINGEIYCSPTSGGSAIQLNAGHANAKRFIITQDSKYVFFIMDWDGLYRSNLNGGNLTRLGPINTYASGNFELTPDNSRVLYIATAPGLSTFRQIASSGSDDIMVFSDIDPFFAIHLCQSGRRVLFLSYDRKNLYSAPIPFNPFAKASFVDDIYNGYH